MSQQQVKSGERTLAILLEGEFTLLVVVLVLAATPVLSSLFYVSVRGLFFISKCATVAAAEAGARVAGAG